MKAVLISIQPKWVEEICHKIGETNEKPIYKKRIEVRKGRPKEKLPIKCFIYETYDKKYDGIGVCWGQGNIFEHACKKVIGEFICDRIDEYANGEIALSHNTDETCLTNCDLADYIEGSKAYFWYISDLKIYDKPRELYEFYPIKPKRIEDWTNKDDCAYCKYHKWIGSMQEYVEKGKPMREKCTLGKPEPICEYTPPIIRPPQSWCYVEEK